MVSRQSVIVAIAALGVLLSVCPRLAVAADDTELSKSANGVTVYLGIVPAQVVKSELKPGEQPMHGHVPNNLHEYHVIAALFDAATGARVSDATVTAQVSGLGLSGPKRKLETMQIEGTTTFGTFFDLPGADIYTIKLHVERPAPAPAADLEFKYDHRR